ncbi:MAG: hypothetical protein J1F01_10395 [Oscillospiraceae bacterium]|nr:hypothetical protein [Oscillospiraceae bacterium]
MVTPTGITEYCQIGSNHYSNGNAFTSPVLIDGKAYIPIRVIAGMIGGNTNVKWNDGAHDTYYEGAVEFDEESMTLSIETDWTKPVALSDMEARQMYADYDYMMRACYATVSSFFEVFGEGNGEAARAYCTQEFLERQFNNNKLFYQPSAVLFSAYSISMYTDGNMYARAQIGDDYAKRDVMLRMAQQPDGTYLIDDAESLGTVLKETPPDYIDDSGSVVLSYTEPTE